MRYVYRIIHEFSKTENFWEKIKILDKGYTFTAAF